MCLCVRACVCVLYIRHLVISKDIWSDLKIFVNFVSDKKCNYSFVILLGLCFFLFIELLR